MTWRRRLLFVVVSVLVSGMAVATQPASVAVGAPLPLVPIIAGGEHHSLVLSGNGILFTFGENFYGQLGTTINNGTLAGGVPLPNPVPTQVMTNVDSTPATVDGQFQGIGLRGAGSTTQLQVTTRGGVPANGGTAVLNVTVTGATGVGFVTVYPCGSPQPNSSNLNYVVGSTIANLVVTKIGAGGKVCIFTSAGTHIIADVNGYYAA